MKKAVVTGALGYLGSRLCEELAESFPGVEIWAVDDGSAQSPERFVFFKDFWAQKQYKVRGIRGDILDLDLKDLFAGSEAVFHFAAVTDPSSSFSHSDRVYLVNTQGTQRVAEACLKTGSSLIFPSTTSVYAKESGWIDESESEKYLGPQTPYADSKLRAERILREIASRSELKYTTLRLGTVYGFSQGIHFRTAVQKFCREAFETRGVRVWESALSQIRPYCDIGDAVKAMIFTAVHRDLQGLTVHAASDHATVRDLMRILEGIFPGLKVQTVAHQAMNAYSYQVSCEALKNRGFQFRGSLRRGMDEVINYMRRDSQFRERR